MHASSYHNLLAIHIYFISKHVSEQLPPLLVWSSFWAHSIFMRGLRRSWQTLIFNIQKNVPLFMVPTSSDNDYYFSLPRANILNVGWWVFRVSETTHQLHSNSIYSDKYWGQELCDAAPSAGSERFPPSAFHIGFSPSTELVCRLSHNAAVHQASFKTPLKENPSIEHDSNITLMKTKLHFFRCELDCKYYDP